MIARRLEFPDAELYARVKPQQLENQQLENQQLENQQLKDFSTKPVPLEGER